jgi:hypothetical protein
MRWVAILALVGGCFTKPDPPPGVCGSQPSAPGLDVDLGPAPVVRFPGNVELGFASDASTFPMPISLRVNGQELIATPESCNNEDQVGIAVYPAFSIAGNDAPPANSMKVLDRVLSGPAVTVFQTNWLYSYSTCSATPTMGSGNTQWSMFPDGRIVRNDFILPTTMATVTAATSGCACSGAQGQMHFIVTSYTAFETSALTSVTADTQTMESTQVPAPMSTQTRSNRGCVRASGNGRVALRWDLVFEAEPSTYPTRIRSARTGMGHDETVFVYDMVPDGQMTQLSNVRPYGVRTHMLVDGSNLRDCIRMTTDVNSYAEINPMTIDGMLVSYSAQGIYDDSAITHREHSEPVTVSATSGTIPGGFVVAVKIPGSTAIRTSPQTEGVVWQRRESDDTFYVFFPEPLVGNQSITITPEC